MIEKRVHKRFNYELALRFYSGDSLQSLYYGTIKNISKNGMHIDTMACFLYDTDIELLICLQDSILNVPTKVRRVVMEDDFYCAMGLTILNPSNEYLEFLRGIQ